MECAFSLTFPPSFPQPQFHTTNRHTMPRNVHAMWVMVVLALGCTLSGLVGNIVKDVQILVYFLIYFGVTLAVVMSMFARVKLLKILLYFLSTTFLDRYVVSSFLLPLFSLTCLPTRPNAFPYR